MITDLELGWLAGVLEGEACFSVGNSITIRVNMTDEDIVRHIARLFDVPVYGPRLQKGLGKKPVFEVGIHGSPAAAWMMTLWPLMGSRRRQKIAECLRFWRKQEQRNGRKQFCRKGHPLAGENLQHMGDQRKRPHRVCRICSNARNQSYRDRRKASVA